MAKQMLDPVRQLIVDALRQRELTKKAASKLIGKNETYLQQYIERGVPRRLPEEARESLANLLKLPSDILKGAKTAEAFREEATRIDQVAVDDLSLNRHRSVTVPELDIRAGQGGGREVMSEAKIAEWSIPENILNAQSTAPPSAFRIIQALGPSNEPDIPSGARLMIDTSHRSPSPPGYYALWDGLGLVIKRLEYLLNSNPPTIRISSANPAYAVYERTLDEVSIAGRVMGRWGWM